MSRLNSKLVLKTTMQTDPDDGEKMFEIVKSTNTLTHGIPGDILTRITVDTILKSAENRGQRNTLIVEFVK